ncbi:hypothetical protein [Pseudoalteromonas sp. TAE56]|uniref:hypothetical protein n=1 Tax=Pseudoalteromonas sp. TAE56 TaxID=1938596 RepID=UPI00040FF13B|nr:hypothetical protein [Pseudoalteromonas sp. TAE56]
MQVDDIRVFIPCKSYEQSQRFYKTLAENLMLQLCVLNIDEAYKLISNLSGFDIRFEGIKRGRVELYGLKFVQSRGDLIAAQGL